MVADTFSATLGVLLMGTGNDSNTWGTNCNTSVFQVFEDAIANIVTFTDTSGTRDLSTTPPPSGPSAARFWQLKFTGSLIGNLTVKVPNLSKEWIINNACTLNGFVLQVETPSGSPVTIPSGYMRVWCDGANNIIVSPYGSKQAVVPTGSAAAPQYSDVNESNSGLYRNGTQDWRFSAAGTDIFRVTGAGSGAAAKLLDLLAGTSLAFAGVAFDPTAVVPSGLEADWDGIVAPSGWYLCDGSAKSRTTDANLFNAITAATTGNTHTSTTIDGIPTDWRNLGIEGAFVEGAGIPTGTTIVSVSLSSFTLSQAATSTATGISIRILPWGQGDASTTFQVPDRRGLVVAGRDNMGGTAAGRLTDATTQGILGTKLNAIGGEEAHVQTQAEMPSHSHTATSTVTDLGHVHQEFRHDLGATGSGGNAILDTANAPTETARNTNSATTGITVGTTIALTGGGTAHNNVQPTGIANKIIKR